MRFRVVELYYSLPFYNRGADTLEKAAVNLGVSVKTALLEPGQKETYACNRAKTLYRSSLPSMPRT